MLENDSGKAEFLKQFPVPHETLHRLERYVALLLEWNEKFNLIAASTIPTVWHRHVLDSAQLINHLPEAGHSLADIGSGAGFPALVLAIMRPELEVHCIESTGKKANFLKMAATELGLSTVVHNERAESIHDLKVDVVTARAAAPLLDLLSWSKSLINKQHLCLFLKGQKAEAELTAAHKYWTFACEKLPSLTDDSGIVLKISELRIARHHEHTHKNF